MNYRGVRFVFMAAELQEQWEQKSGTLSAHVLSGGG